MKIYFLELSWLYIVPILVCRLIGLKVYFLDCKSFWLRQKTLPLLSRIGVSWLSHQDLINIRGGLIYKKVFETSENVAKFLFTTKGYKLLLSELNCGVDLRSALISRIFVDYERQIELIAIIESMSGDNKKNPSLICIPNTIVSRFILQRETCLRNIYPIFLTNLGVIFTYISYILKKTRTSLVSRFEKIVCLSYSRSENQVNFKLNYDSVEVCFFPHKGIYYGDLYIKDCFYSANPNSPFFKEKILHIETEGGPPDNSVRFYRENNIKYFLWSQIPIPKITLFLDSISVIRKLLKCKNGSLDLELIIFYVYFYAVVLSTRIRLSHLPNLKIALIGYDALFPQAMCAAFSTKGVKTVAAQERIIASFCMPALPVDYYFLVSPLSKSMIGKYKSGSTVFFDIGPIRSRNYLQAKIPKALLEVREKYQTVALMLDMHSVDSWFDNGRNVVNNWRNNYIFYEHLLGLSRAFPQVYFLLKGKDTQFKNIDYFNSITQEIELKKNILILEDHEIWTPFTSVASSDIVIARHTSLADDALALGKPVILDDYDGFPSDLLDLGPELAARKFSDLQFKLNAYLENPSAYNSNLDKFRDIFYFPSHAKNTDQIIQNGLHRVWADSALRL